MKMKQSLFWLGPAEAGALQFLRQKHGHEEKCHVAPVVRFAIERALLVGEQEAPLLALARSMGRVRSGGRLNRGEAPPGWLLITPRLGVKHLRSIRQARKYWDLSTDQAAVRFSILAQAVRDGYEGYEVGIVPA